MPVERSLLRQRLWELRRRYAAELPERVFRLTQPLLEAADADLGGQRQDLEARAHALAGGAGSYGFEPVGVWARALERALEPGAEEPSVARLQSLALGLASATERASRRAAMADPPGAPRIDLILADPWPALALATRLRRVGLAAAVHEDPEGWLSGADEGAPAALVLDPSLPDAVRVAEAAAGSVLIALAPGPPRPAWQGVAAAAAGWYLQPPDLERLVPAVLAAAAGAPEEQPEADAVLLSGAEALMAGLGEILEGVASRGETLALVYLAVPEGGQAAAWGEALARRCRPQDRIAPVGPQAWAVALPDCGAGAATRFGRELCRGAALRAGIALYPLAGSPEALLAAARRAWSETRADEPVALDRGGPAAP